MRNPAVAWARRYNREEQNTQTASTEATQDAAQQPTAVQRPLTFAATDLTGIGMRYLAALSHYLAFAQSGEDLLPEGLSQETATLFQIRERPNSAVQLGSFQAGWLAAQKSRHAASKAADRNPGTWLPDSNGGVADLAASGARRSTGLPR